MSKKFDANKAENLGEVCSKVNHVVLNLTRYGIFKDREAICCGCGRACPGTISPPDRCVKH
jgi:hypothetical protein